jgi:hypothetical protein
MEFSNNRKELSSKSDIASTLAIRKGYQQNFGIAPANP